MNEGARKAAALTNRIALMLLLDYLIRAMRIADAKEREVHHGRPQGEEARPEAGEGSPQVPERGAALRRIPQDERGA